jgi:acetyl esterase
MLDPDVARMIAESAAADPVESLTVEQARAAIRGVMAYQGERTTKVRTEGVIVPGDGGPLAVRLYRPADASQPSPVLIWAHAGGFVRGDLDTWDTPLCNLAERTRATIASVDYRLAPETPFPGAVEDMLAAVRYLIDHASQLGLDPARIAVGGDSAGGNLAAATALAARDLGVQPPLVAQVLIHPPLDPACASDSARLYADGYLLTRTGILADWSAYLPTPYAGDHPYAAPLRARNLAALPPAIIATAEYDLLRDEGEAYAARLAVAGVPVRLRRFDGMVHSFFHYNGRVPASRALPAWLADELQPFLR